MVGIDIIRDVLASHNFRFESACNWRGLSFAWADYLYPQTGAVLAKYLFIPLTLSEWYDFQTSFEEFLTDVVENIYYSLHNDLCWNLYLVCVLTDEDFSCIDSHARFHFESNTDYVRNLILPMAKLNERLPVGHTLSQFEDRPLIDPEKEWREILGDFDFCLEPFDSDLFAMCANGRSPRKASNSDTIDLTGEKIQSISSVHIPNLFLLIPKSLRKRGEHSNHCRRPVWKKTD